MLIDDALKEPDPHTVVVLYTAATALNPFTV